MNRIIRIGSRDSELALWQANTVKAKLLQTGTRSEIVKIKSEGDLKTDVPLYELGITGIFTRSLDSAMLKNEVDIAVHSLKDVPTVLPNGIIKVAVLKRANPRDVLVHKGLDFLNTEGILATGSLRRKSQWLHRYPLHQITDLRGNVPTRLKKLEEQDWNGAIFAAAGLERLGYRLKNSVELQWMIPAPGQGAIMIVARSEDKSVHEKLKPLNDPDTDLCTTTERDFLRELEGGCQAPIGALAEIRDNTINFTGLLSSTDGQNLIRVTEKTAKGKSDGFGVKCARKVLVNGGEEIMNTINQNRKK